MQLQTVKIKAENEQGFIVINESDLSKEQELFTDKKEVNNDYIGVEIEDMKKPQLTAYIKDNKITLPAEITKVDDIKIFLMEL